MRFKRKCDRRSFKFNGFELTTSVETFTRYDAVDRPMKQHKVTNLYHRDTIIRDFVYQNLYHNRYRLMFMFTVVIVGGCLIRTEDVTGDLEILSDSSQKC